MERKSWKRVRRVTLFFLLNSVDHENLKDFFTLVKIEAVTKNLSNLLWRRAQKVFFVKTYETLKTCQAATLTNQVSTFFILSINENI